jgi:hypothetical protein
MPATLRLASERPEAARAPLAQAAAKLEALQLVAAQLAAAERLAHARPMREAADAAQMRVPVVRRDRHRELATEAAATLEPIKIC